MCGCCDAIMGYAANTGEPWEPSRVQTAGVSSGSQRCRPNQRLGIVQGCHSSGNSHVVDLKGAEMDGDKTVELEHLEFKVPVL